MAVNNLIKVRRGTSSDWTANPTLAEGEPGFDTTNNILKIGDGSTAWNSLPAINNNTYITSVEDDGSPILGGSLTLDQHDINVQVKNDSGSSISAGTPVYIAGYHAGSSKPLIAPANASSTSTMPAFGIVESAIADGAEGVVAIMGIVAGIDTTSPISFSTNDIVYVKAGGGLTNVKPTGVDEKIQNLGKVTKVHASNGRILLLGAGRANDIPNSGTFTGNIQAASFIKSGGTSSQFLKADGSVDTNTYSTTDTQLTEEQVEDFVGGMVTGNTETFIAVTYEDSDGTLDFVVPVKDEDNMASNSATHLATQQSIKAYVDANAGGGGSMTTVKGDGSQVGGADIVTLDFSDKFTVAESPDTEINIGLSTEVLSSGDLSTTLSGSTGISLAYDSSADTIGINIDPTLISSRTEVTSADADYLLVWDATDSELKKVDAGEFRGSTLTEEQVEDFVGGMLTGNTETGITVTYQDADGTIDFVVASQTDENFTTADHSKLDGIEAGADVTDTANVDAAGAVMNSDSSTASMSFVVDEDNMASDSATKVPTQQSVKAYVDANAGGGGSMTTVKGNGSQVGGADIVTLDFSSEFAITESPDTEINIGLSDEILSSGDLSTTLSGSAGISLAYDSSADAIGLNIDINGSTDLTAPAVGDELIISDASDSNSIKKADVASVVNLADHDALTNFVANEHIDHTSVTLTAGDGLTGGGDISANRTFAVSVDDSTIEINSDALRIKDGAITSAKIGAGGFVFNEAGAAVDFRVEGDTDIDLLFVDGSEDTVQIGKLNINGAFTLPTADGSANQILKTDGNGTVSWAADGGGGGGGSMTTVKANGSQVGGADIVTLDFSNEFAVTESPDTEINIALSDEILSSGDLSVTLSGGTGIHLGYVSAADAMGFNVSPALISARTEVTSADADYLLVWDATDSQLKKVDAGEFRVSPALISARTEVTSADADYLLVWDATDSEVKKVDAGEFRGGGGGITATTGLNIGVSGLHHQSGSIVHSTEAAWGEFPGNAQNTINLLTGKTTNATFTSLPMNNGMYSGVKLPSNKTFFADVNIVGRRTNGGQTNKQHAAYQLKACISNDAFGRDFVGSVSKTVIAESNSAWDVQLAFAGGGSGQTDYLLVQCKGAASTNVNWVAKVDLLEVGGLNETSAYREANILTNISPEIIP